MWDGMGLEISLTAKVMVMATATIMTTTMTMTIIHCTVTMCNNLKNILCIKSPFCCRLFSVWVQNWSTLSRSKWRPQVISWNARSVTTWKIAAKHFVRWAWVTLSVLNIIKFLCFTWSDLCKALQPHSHEVSHIKRPQFANHQVQGDPRAVWNTSGTLLNSWIWAFLPHRLCGIVVTFVES